MLCAALDDSMMTARAWTATDYGERSRCWTNVKSRGQGGTDWISEIITTRRRGMGHHQRGIGDEIHFNGKGSLPGSEVSLNGGDKERDRE